MWCKVCRSSFIFSHVTIQFFPVPFVEETVLFPLNGFGTKWFVENHLNTYVRVYFWTPCALPWSVCLSLCHYSTVLITLISLEVNFEIWKCKISNFVLFQYCFGDLESSWDSMWILVWDFLFLGKKTSLGFDRDCVESVDGFG